MILTFDCYGTLIDTAPLLREVGDMAKEAGLPEERVMALFPVYEARAMYGEAYCDYDQVVLHALEYMDFEFCCDVFKKQQERALECIRNFKAFPEVREILAKLKADGHKLYLMSNSKRELMEYHLKELGSPFEYEILADETHCYKPNLEFFRYSEDLLGLRELDKKEHCHIAEGFFWDIIPAAYFRWNTIWVNRSRQQGNGRGGGYTEVHDLKEAYQALVKFKNSL